ncbi:unnamed protein product [Rhizopus stolonifer]
MTMKEVSIYKKSVHHLPFRHTNCSEGSTITSIDVKIQDACQILRLISYEQSESQLKPVKLSSSSSSRSSSSLARKGFQVADVKHVRQRHIPDLIPRNSAFHSSTAAFKNWPI